MANPQRSRGRPRLNPEAVENKKSQIIVVAKTLFYEQGFESISMRKIAQEVGMGTMTLYQYFANKGQILHHIWGEFFLELVDRINTEIEPLKEPHEKLARWCEVYLDYWFEHPDRFRMVFLNEDTPADKADTFLSLSKIDQQFFETAFPLLKDIFPEKSDQDLIAIGELVICNIHGIALNLITVSEYSWTSRKKLLNTFLNTICFQIR